MMNVVAFKNLEPFFSIYPDSFLLKDLTELNEGLNPLAFCLSFNKEKSLNMTTEQWDYLIKNSNIHFNYSHNKHALILYFKNKKDQCIDLTEEQVDYLINNTRLRIPYKGAWPAVQHFLNCHFEQEICITESQFSTLVTECDLTYIDSDGFNFFKNLIKSYHKKPFTISNSIWLHIIKNSDLFTTGSKGNIPLMDACYCDHSFNWDDEHWDYLIKNSNLNHQSTYGRTPLMVAVMNADRVEMSDELWTYFFKNTNLRARDSENQDVFSFMKPESPKYDFFKGLFDKYKNNPFGKYNVKKVEEVKEFLGGLTGLLDVKNYFNSLMNLANIHTKKGLNPAGHMRVLFVGNQGTGKGLISNHMSNLYHALNLTGSSENIKLGNSFFYYKNGDFLAAYESLIGRTIYHEYSSMKDDKDKEFEPALLGFLNTVGDSSLFILAISPSDLEELRFKYPKAYSLFTKTIYFPDYTSEELVKLTQYMAVRYNLELNETCKKTLVSYYAGKVKDTYSPFINGYLAKETLVKMMEAHSTRLNHFDENGALKVNEEELLYLTENDIPFFSEQEREENINELINEFNGMIGLDSVKNNLLKLIALTKANKKRGTEISTSMHLVFTGNPGTGKTTIARMIGRIYKTLGLLPHGHVVETDRSGLVSGYVGQTALKTKETVNKAMGGVLFIDEAYALTTGESSRQDFGKEAVETLLKLMEDHRKNLAVIVAGYPEEMQKFIEMNPGLKSRFTKTLVFQDYSMEELINIFKGICDKEGFKYDDDVLLKVTEILKDKKETQGKKLIGFTSTPTIIYQNNDKFFGNAREVRTIFEKSLEKQALRIMSDDASDPWQFMACDIVLED